MNLHKSLQKKVKELFKHALGPHSLGDLPGKTPKTYELYVFALLADELEKRGFQPAIVPLGGRFVAPGGPRSLKTSKYPYVMFSTEKGARELHMNVEFTGTSGATHEVDVSLVDAARADECRGNHEPQEPTHEALEGAIECKFHEGGSLRTVEARALVGLLRDMGRQQKPAGLTSNGTSCSVARYLKPKGRPRAFLGLKPDDPDSEKRFTDEFLKRAKLQPPDCTCHFDLNGEVIG